MGHRAILGIFQHVQLPNTARVFGEPAIPTLARPSFPAGIDDCMGITEPEVHAEPAQAKIFNLPVRMMHIHTDRKCDTATVLFSDGRLNGYVPMHDVPLATHFHGTADF